MRISDEWQDYEILSAGNGEKLERWGNVILRRPDPIAMWPISNDALWDKADAFYHRSKDGGGSWEYKQKLPEFWLIKYKELTKNFTSMEHYEDIMEIPKYNNSKENKSIEKEDFER